MSAWTTLIAIVVGWGIAQSAMEFQSRRPKPDKTLFPVGPATGGLTERQATALDHLQANPEGVRSIDLGSYLHQALGVPCSCSSVAPAWVACKWAGSDGERVGKQLRARDLAIKRKSGRWQALVRAPSPPGEIPY